MDSAKAKAFIDRGELNINKDNVWKLTLGNFGVSIFPIAAILMNNSIIVCGNLIKGGVQIIKR